MMTRKLSLAALLRMAAIGMTGTARAGDFTAEECASIFGVGAAVVKTVGVDKLSSQFRQSFVDFLGTNNTCDGPKDILTPTGNDIDAFNTIQGLLQFGSKPIYLQRAGLRSVDPAKVEALRPDANKRSEVDAAAQPQVR